MRVFLDANVLFTATASPEGKSAYLARIAGKAGITLLTCSLAVEEADRNLRAKFPARASRLSALLDKVVTVPTAFEGKCPVRLPDKDIPIFLSAVSSRATHLLTGDLKDFGPFMNRPDKSGGIIVQTVGDFLRSWGHI